jgi:hypothetical protein
VERNVSRRWLESVLLDQQLRSNSFTGVRTGGVPLRRRHASSVPILQACIGGFQKLGTAIVLPLATLLRDS